MPSLLIRRVTMSFSAAFVALLLLVAGLASSNLPQAHADESVSVVLTPATVSASPGQNLTVTVNVTNSGSGTLAAGEAIFTAPSAALSTVADLDAWFAAEDNDAQPGRYLATADVPEIAAGKSADVVIELPLSSGRFGGIWGVRGLAVDYQVGGDSVGSARSSFVWTTAVTPEKTAFTGILPIVPPPSTSGLLTAEELTELTGPSGILTRQLDVARGRPVVLAVDPRILASIEALGEKAPETVLSWLGVLTSLPNESFVLAYADADISAQAQSGASALISPSTTDVIVPVVEAVPSATPSPTAAPLPTAAVFTPTLNDVAWPVASSVIGSDLGIFSASGLTTAILSSTNVNGNDMSAGVAGGLPSVVTLSGLSSALNHNDVSRAASYLAVSSVDESQGGRSFAALPRETFSITGLTKLGLTLDTLLAQEWVSTGTMSSGLASASSALEIVDSPESSQRISVVSNLLARNASVSAFSTIAEDPSLITNPATRELAAVLSVGWLGNSDWSTAVGESLRSSEKVLKSVSVVTSSTINMVGGQANIPLSVYNGLLQPVTVVVNADPNNARLIVKGSEKVTIQPESQAKAQIPVQAQVSNGSSVLTVSLQSVDGVAIGEPVSIPINVRADWETWGLGAVALAFVGLLTAGVIRTLRRRKTGSPEAS
ncbi:DUF6049 family protein [Aurantimicrobium minutum]|uniref:DUF6049 family protein n=1 Tax=Aurantimicrobium minutum TaxID=708131 RepID=UPI002474621B|nr:DUF6049 family protein [Aurantimicrobium minutum]MDH6207550.1 hypothetical protein [Aurantimicrobium minutum]